MKVDNAIIMAAGASTRFAPLSYERHKALTVVMGEVLIERQIGQLKEAGIKDIIVVTGYLSEQFKYLEYSHGVRLIKNPEFATRNNNGSIYAARSEINNSYICSADNYFTDNPFEREVSDSYYAVEYTDVHTEEWCVSVDENDMINSVRIGGSASWYMMGHAFWDEVFSKEFLSILEREYRLPSTRYKLWESIYMEHLDVLKMKARRYKQGTIYEFDTLDELRCFDTSYVEDSHSSYIKRAAKVLNCREGDIVNIKPVVENDTKTIGFDFECCEKRYRFLYADIIPNLL